MKLTKKDYEIYGEKKPIAVLDVDTISKTEYYELLGIENNKYVIIRTQDEYLETQRVKIYRVGNKLGFYIDGLVFYLSDFLTLFDIKGTIEGEKKNYRFKKEVYDISEEEVLEYLNHYFNNRNEKIKNIKVNKQYDYEKLHEVVFKKAENYQEKKITTSIVTKRKAKYDKVMVLGDRKVMIYNTLSIEDWRVQAIIKTLRNRRIKHNIIEKQFTIEIEVFEE